jgi:hypothetical protein
VLRGLMIDRTTISAIAAEFGGFVTLIIDPTPAQDGTDPARLLDLVTGRSAAARRCTGCGRGHIAVDDGVGDRHTEFDGPYATATATGDGVGSDTGRPGSRWNGGFDTGILCRLGPGLVRRHDFRALISTNHRCTPVSDELPKGNSLAVLPGRLFL